MSNYIEHTQIKLKHMNTLIDDNGELPLGARLKLFEIEEECRQEEKYFRRQLFCKTECKCAFFTWHFWTDNISETDPMDLLKLAISSNLSGDVQAKRGKLLTFLENKLYHGAPFNAIYAGFSCWAAIGSLTIGISRAISNLTEKEIDPTEWMAAYHSSIAYAGKAIWEENPDNQKRKEFWLWYLNECIPESIKEIESEI